jgi:hypothetical protein
MVFGNWRRAVTLAASALAAVAFAIAVAGRGCGGVDHGPEGTVRSLIAAARAGDREGILELLGPRTREKLLAETETASQQAGGRVQFDELDLIGLGRPTEGWSPRKITRRDDGDQVLVDVEDNAGNVASIPMVYEDGGWKVEVVDYRKDRDRSGAH